MKSRELNKMSREEMKNRLYSIIDEIEECERYSDDKKELQRLLSNFDKLINTYRRLAMKEYLSNIVTQ